MSKGSVGMLGGYGTSHHQMACKEWEIKDAMTPRTAWVSQSCQDTTIKCYLAWMDLGCSDLFERHMQSGHGKVYTDSFALFISMPLASLCALILNNCRFSDFHPIRGLSKSMANLLLSGLIVFAWPPYKYLLWPIRK